MVCVLPGVCDTLANDFRLVSILINDDFPTLERPIKAYSGLSASGQPLNLTALFT